MPKSAPIDIGSVRDAVTPVKELPESTRAAARRTLARNAVNADELRMFLEMCGLAPAQPRQPRQSGGALVSADKASAHIGRLRDAGWSLIQIADASGVTYPTVANLATKSGRQTIKATADAILALEVDE
ncbi:hypothetical protein [Nocardia tengchongensis]|uniref:hypothetical protein n=1 Tax=Nocardia tengchongensis TaxID=2055889 RepID=UPI00369827A0